MNNNNNYNNVNNSFNRYNNNNYTSEENDLNSYSNNLKRKLYDNENIFEELSNINNNDNNHDNSINNNNNNDNNNNNSIDNNNHKRIKFSGDNSNEEYEESIDEKNLNYYWSLAHSTQPTNPKLGGYYMYKFRELANIKQLRGVPTMIESRNCTNCGMFLIPGVNCRVRIIKTDKLSNRSRSLISSNKKEINSLEFRLKSTNTSSNSSATAVAINKNSNKLNNSIIRVCLVCSKLNALKGESKLKRNQRKSILKQFKKENNNNNTNNNNNNNSINNNNKIDSKLNNNNSSKNNNNKNTITNNKQQSNNNSSKNNKIKIQPAGSKNLANKKEDSLKDFLSGMGLLK